MSRLRLKKTVVLLFLFTIISLTVIPELVTALESYTFVSELNGYNPEVRNFYTPADVAVDSSNNIYVLDYSGDSIKKFTSQYEVLPLTFDQTFDFTYSGSVTLDGSGNIYVTDYLNVRKFSSGGIWQASIGTWSAGGLSGEYPKIPRSVAVDSASNVYVLGMGSIQIEGTNVPEYFVYKFSSSGYTESIFCGGGFDSNYKFLELSGVAVYGSSVYVAVKTNQTIQKFSDSGVLQASWSLGFTPSVLETDNLGNVFVTNPDSNCVEKFSSSGVLLATIGVSGSSGSAQGQFYFPMGVAIDGSGYVYVADYGNTRVQKFSQEGTFISLLDGYVPETHNFNEPIDVAVDSSGNIYVIDYSSESIKKFNNGYEVLPLTFDRTFNFIGSIGSIALDGDGNIYVCDYLNVRKFSPEGAFIASIGTWTAGGSFPSIDYPKIPASIAVDDDSNVYVLGSGVGLIEGTEFPEYCVYKFSYSGYVESVFYESGLDSNYQFVTLAGIAAYGDYVYVGVAGSKTILKFSSSGELVTSWDIAYTPSLIETDLAGNIFVTSITSNCVQKFSSSGELLATIGVPGSYGTGQGQFDGTMGVATDNGFVYVTDFGNNRVQKFCPVTSPPPVSNYQFVFNTIPTPQYVGVPISTSVSVWDSPLHPTTAWSGTATLTCSNGAGISPSTINIVNGYWEGELTIDSSGTLITIIATATDGTTGHSLNFNVLDGLAVVPEPPFWLGLLCVAAAVALVTLYRKRSPN